MMIEQSREQAEQQFVKKVKAERERQDEKWGRQTHLGHAWCGILLEELGEFAQAVNDGDWENAEYELVQISACCQAAYAQSRVDQTLDPQWGEYGNQITPQRERSDAE